MDILVDDHPSPVEGRPTETVGAFLGRLRGHLAAEGRVLTSLLIDGDEASPERWVALLATPIEAIGSVRVTSAAPLAAAAATVEALRAGLPLLRPEQERAAALLQAGDRARGLGVFRACLSMWETVQQAMRLTVQWVGRVPDGPEAAGRDASDRPGFPDRDLLGATEALAGALRNVRDALEADDLTALSDVIEADLNPLVDRWLGVLTALADRVEAEKEKPDPA